MLVCLMHCCWHCSVTVSPHPQFPAATSLCWWRWHDRWWAGVEGNTWSSRTESSAARDWRWASTTRVQTWWRGIASVCCRLFQMIKSSTDKAPTGSDAQVAVREHFLGELVFPREYVRVKFPHIWGDFSGGVNFWACCPGWVSVSTCRITSLYVLRLRFGPPWLTHTQTDSSWMVTYDKLSQR